MQAYWSCLYFAGVISPFFICSKIYCFRSKQMQKTLLSFSFSLINSSKALRLVTFPISNPSFATIFDCPTSFFCFYSAFGFSSIFLGWVGLFAGLASSKSSSSESILISSSPERSIDSSSSSAFIGFIFYPFYNF